MVARINQVSFEGINLKEFPQLMIRLNTELKKLGIAKLINASNTSITRDTFCPKLTLYVYAGIFEEYSERLSNLPEIRTFLEKLEGFSSEYNQDIYFWDYNVLTENGEKVIPIITQAGDTDFEVGYYLKDRNILLCKLNIFYNLHLQLKNEFILWFLEVLKDFCKRNEVKKVDIKKKVEEIAMRNFMGSLKTKYTELERKMKDNNDNINNYHSSIVRLKQENEVSKVQMKSLKQVDICSILHKQIKEIKELKFVKSVCLDSGSIMIEIPKIYCKDDEGDKILIGDFVVRLYADKVEIKNVKNENPNTSEHHPHITGESICFGNRDEKVYELLHQFEYKQLVYFLYQFLTSYQSDDCYSSISNWGGSDDERENEDDICSECGNHFSDCTCEN